MQTYGHCRAILGLLFAAVVAVEGSELSSLVNIIKRTSNPQALANNLLEQAQSNSGLSASCDGQYGPHLGTTLKCKECILPVLHGLIEQLAKIKKTLWAERKKFNTKATAACTSKPPSSRHDAYTKCCASNFGGGYRPLGFTGCAKKTIEITNMQRTELQLSTDLQFPARHNTPRWYGPAHARTINQCCDTGSVCYNNEYRYSRHLLALQSKTSSAFRNYHHQQMLISALNSGITVREMEISSFITDIEKICKHKTCKWTAAASVQCIRLDIDTYVHSCVSGHLLDQWAKGNATLTQTTRQTTHLHTTQTVLKKVIDLVKTKEQPKSRANAAASASNNGAAVVESIQLLEQSKTLQGASLISNMAIDQATELIQSATAAGSSTNWVQVIFLLNELLGKVKDQYTKHLNYAKSLQGASARETFERVTEIKSYSRGVSAKQAEIGTLHGRKGTAQSSSAMFKQLETDGRSEYGKYWKLRELNTQKCQSTLSYYDAEEVARSRELLILRKAISILQLLNCHSSYLDMTRRPTPLSRTPTPVPSPFPTASPTLLHTFAPTSAQPIFTKAPTPVAGDCAAGTYKFKAKVFGAKKASYGVPAYMNGATFKIKATKAGACQTLTTVHKVRQGNNVGGSHFTFVDVYVRHAYRCCGASDSFHGSIAVTDGKVQGVIHDLCSSIVKQCDLFSDNMEMVGSPHAVSQNSESGASPADLNAYLSTGAY